MYSNLNSTTEKKKIRKETANQLCQICMRNLDQSLEEFETKIYGLHHHFRSHNNTSCHTGLHKKNKERSEQYVKSEGEQM